MPARDRAATDDRRPLAPPRAERRVARDSIIDYQNIFIIFKMSIDIHERDALPFVQYGRNLMG